MKIFPSSTQFAQWKGNFKPCWTEFKISQAEQQATLFALFQNFQSSDSCFLYSGKTGRYSVLAKNPFHTFVYKNQQSFFDQTEILENPLVFLRRVFRKFSTPKSKELPPFWGGAIGFFGYESFALFENIPQAKLNDLNTPDLYINFYDQIIVFDHFKSKFFLIGSAEKYSEAKQKVEALIKIFTSTQVKIFQKNTFQPTSIKANKDQFTSNFSKKSYFQAIQKVKDYLILGDTFQVNLSQRLEGKLTQNPAEIFQRMMQINPSPFSSFFNGGDFQIVSASPERLVRLKDKELFTQPIAGTRKRGQTEKEDEKLAQELKNSIKEMAEHTMLVDLERNDLGKISEFGSVITKSFAHIEKYSHVQHLVSNIYGKIRSDQDFFDVLKAMFPGGTITGAPKIRTMEIISELEPTQRGPYTGSLGYIGFNGNFDLNILIRTIVCTQKKMYIQVGGGIVMDSDPEKEYLETFQKAQAMLEAIC